MILGGETWQKFPLYCFFQLSYNKTQFLFSSEPQKPAKEAVQNQLQDSRQKLPSSIPGWMDPSDQGQIKGPGGCCCPCTRHEGAADLLSTLPLSQARGILSRAGQDDPVTPSHDSAFPSIFIQYHHQLFFQPVAAQATGGSW